MRNKYIILVLGVALFLGACSKKEEKVAVFELGTTATELNLDAAEGEFTLNVLSDGEFTAEISSGAGWCHFVDKEPGAVFSGSGDLAIKLHKDLNRSILRKGEIILRRMGKTLCVPVYQKGILSESVSFSGHYLGVEAEGGQVAAPISSLQDGENLAISVTYTGEQDKWLSGIRKQNNYIIMEVSANQTDRVRTAEVTVTVPDGSADRLIINQKGISKAPVSVNFAALKAMASGAETLLSGNLILEGTVISDNLEGNGSYNVNITPVLLDEDRCKRVFYIQNEDATSGLMLSFNEASDNALARYDKVSILLDGLLLRKETEPMRYSLEGLTASSISSAVAGSEHMVPRKEKRIAELTDDDIYTLVTLKDCEIPFRKGPFVPVDLRYKSVLNKYAMPVRDINGDGLYLMSNTGCSWERDGEPMPQGSGSITGVIVHEKSDNFEWDNAAAASMQADGMGQDYIHGIGTIGRYQIRPFSKKEIDLASNFNEGFSELLMEVRYFNASYDNMVKNVAADIVYSTWPAVANPTSDSAIKGTLSLVSGGKTQAITPWRDWSHLGPLENNLIANPYGGNGVYDFLGNSAHWYIYSSVSQSALIYPNNGSAWASDKWTTSKWWQAEFSTLDLTVNNFPLSVQFGAENSLGEGVGAPRYWKLEYSLDGTDWTPVAEYTVPDFPVVYKRKPWQCPGFKMFSFNLPEDEQLLGREKVFLRLVPAVNKAGQEESYDSGTIVSGQSSALNYFSIRYNKI